MLTTAYRTQIDQRKQMAYGRLLTQHRRGLITLEEMTKACDEIETLFRAAYMAHERLCAADNAFSIRLSRLRA